MTELPDERTALFVDGANLHYAARSLGLNIDYRRLLERFAAEGRLVRAYYYTALFDEAEYSPIRPLIDWLDYNGYSLVTKRAREFTDAHGNRRVKSTVECARLTGTSAAGESPAGRRRQATTSTPSHGPSSARTGVKR